MSTPGNLMRLSGQQVKQIQDALLDAYSTRTSLRIMVRTGLEKDLEAIAEGANQQELIFDLIRWAEQYDLVSELIGAARNHNPGNESLHQLVEILGPAPRPSAPSPAPILDPVLTPAYLAPNADIFLSYSRRDADAMRTAHEALKAVGLKVWDDEGLAPGTPSWRAAIEQAIQHCKAMVVLLTPSANHSVWVDNEVAYAQTLGKRIFPILVSGDPASAVPINLIRVQWLDGRQNLKRVVEEELQPHLLRQIGDAFAPMNQALDIEWILVPAGPFVMGSDDRLDPHATRDEMPQHRLVLPGFCVSRFPITNAQYGRFVAATGHPCPSHWAGGRIPPGRERHPVVNVSWHDARAFCMWAGVQLPSEAQWEKAARGRDGRLYPWGNAKPGAGCCNCEHAIHDTSPVDAYVAGDSPYGAADMAGNALEWTCSCWGTDVATPKYRYPYNAGDGRESPHAERKMLRVVRGGAFNLPAACARSAFRAAGSPLHGRPNIGFRVSWAEGG